MNYIVPSKLQAEYENMNALIESLEDDIANNPARPLVKYLQRRGEWAGKIEYITPKQYEDITHRKPHATSINKHGKIPWNMVMDQIAPEHGGGDDEAMKERIEKVKVDMEKLKSLKSERADLKKQIQKVQAEGVKADTVETVAAAPVFPKGETVRAESTEIGNYEILSRRNPSFHQVEIDDTTTEKQPDKAFRFRYKKQADKMVRTSVKDIQGKSISNRAPRISPKMRKLK